MAGDCFFKEADKLFHMFERINEEEILHRKQETALSVTTTTSTNHLNPTTPVLIDNGRRRKRPAPSQASPERSSATKRQRANKVEYLYGLTIPAERRLYLLNRMSTFCQTSKHKGKRFKDAHDFSPVNEDLHVEKLIVYAYNMSTPECVICGGKIEKLAARCKFSIANLYNPSRNCERCGTHLYCVECFVVLQSAVLPGEQAVCFGTLLTTRGGCHQLHLPLSTVDM